MVIINILVLVVLGMWGWYYLYDVWRHKKFCERYEARRKAEEKERRLAEEARLAEERQIKEQKAREREQQEFREKMNYILGSDTFRHHEAQVFQNGQYPIRVVWEPSEDSRIQVWFQNSEWAQVYMNVKELPDVFDFMRALNYKYGRSYRYSENKSGAKLTFRQKESGEW